MAAFSHVLDGLLTVFSLQQGTALTHKNILVNPLNPIDKCFDGYSSPLMGAPDFICQIEAVLVKCIMHLAVQHPGQNYISR